MDGEVYEKSLGMRHFRVFRTRRSQSWPLPGPLESVGMERINNLSPTEAAGYTIEGGQEAKTEILAQSNALPTTLLPFGSGW